MVEPAVAPVGVDRGHQVKHPFIEQVRDPVQLAVLMTQIPGRVQDCFPSLDFIAMDVPVNVHAGLALRVSVLEGRDLQAPEGAPTHGLSERHPARQVGKGLVELPEDHVNAFAIIEPIPRHIDLALFGHADGRETVCAGR